MAGHRPPAASLARVIVEVLAGVLPGTPEPEYTRQWALNSEQWRALKGPMEQMAALAELGGQAAGYALLLALQPDRLNWVRTEWIYL